MDMIGAFFSAEVRQAVLVANGVLIPFLLFGVCILLFLNRRRLNSYENDDEARSDDVGGYGLADDPDHYEDGSSDEKPGRGLVEKSAKTKLSPRRRRSFATSFLRKFSNLFTFLGLIVSVVGIGLSLPGEIVPYLSPPPKGLETKLHDDKVIAANGYRDRGDVELALKSNREAMLLHNIPMGENAAPLSSVAEMLIEQGQFERAYWPASISAGLYSDDPEFVNPFAEVLIETCELDAAVDWLEGLEDGQSRQLLERVDTRRSACDER